MTTALASSKQKQMVVGGKNLYPIGIDRDYLLVGHPFLDHTSLPFDVDVLYRHFKSALICLTKIGQKEECHLYISADLYRKL